MEYSYKQISDIHFSLHSVITRQSEETDFDLKELFYRWISARTEDEDYRDIDWLCSPISDHIISPGKSVFDIGEQSQSISR